MEEIQELIIKCLGNDRAAQEKLYRKFYPALFLLCRKFFKDENDALEALNDGMLLVFKNIGQYNNTKGEFFNWIYTVVRHAALDKLKHNHTCVYAFICTATRNKSGMCIILYRGVFDE